LSGIKHNIIASYVSQIYVTLIGIALVPVYVSYMGAEAYGLIGFYAMLQSWFMLLDLGLTPTMSRETARLRGHEADAPGLRALLRTLEGIFVGIGFLGAAAMIAASGLIADSWLKVQTLPVTEVQGSIMLIGVIIALRWISDLYRGVINGFERLVWLGAFNVGIATMRFVFVIPLFVYVGTRPMQFFGYQLVLSVLEVAFLVIEAYRLLPNLPGGQRPSWAWQRLRSLLHFSLAIGFSGVVWTLATQTDKLLLSKLLPLTEYAYFTLAVVMAGGIIVISTPISGALMPRMVALDAEGNEIDFIRLYRNSTQMAAVIVVPAVLVLALFSERVLWAWTGDLQIARHSAMVLTSYALGNGIMALGAFPFYLQYAKGDLKLHMIGSALFLVLLIPTLIWATNRYGMTGAGYAWLGANVGYFVAWVPLVHRRFVSGLHKLWLLDDLALIIVATGLAAVVVRPWVRWPLGRASTAIMILALGLGLLVIAGAASSWLREIVRARWRALSRRATI
jgi:O-antigen/teichoic acid export membrane protein